MSETTPPTATRHWESDEVTVGAVSDPRIDFIATESGDDYISPDMLSSKTSEESIAIKSQTTKKLLTDNTGRHSLTANSPAKSTNEDIPAPYPASLSPISPRSGALLRARKAIEDRRISREAAKARVKADIDALTYGKVNVAGAEGVSKNIGESLPLEASVSKEKVARTKAGAKLRVSKVEPDSNAKTSSLSNAQENVSSSLYDAKADGGHDTVSLKEVNKSDDLAARSMVRDQTGKGNTKKEVKSQRRKESLAANATEEKEDAGYNEKDRIKGESKSKERLAERQLKTDKLKQHRLALIAEKHAETEQRVKQETSIRTQKRQQEAQRMLDEVQRLALVEAQHLEEDRSVAAEGELVSASPAALQYFGIGQNKCENDRARKEADKGLVYIGSSGNHTAAHSKKLIESDESAPFGQVDRILFQGRINEINPSPISLSNQKHKDVLSEDELHEGDSKSHDSEAAGDSSSGSGSGSGSESSYDIESDPGKTSEEAASYDLGSDLSSGPMWKKAAEEAALEAGLAKDLLPKNVLSVAFNPSRSFPQDQNEPTTMRSQSEDLYHQYSSKEEIDEMIEAKVLNDWKGFKRGRMSFMLVFGVIAGVLPSLYVQMTCHFITGEAATGEGDEVDYDLFYGLHKYTPIDAESVHLYGQCLRYDSRYGYDPPIAPRSAGLAATILGTIPLIVIGIYIFSSMRHKILWLGSIWMLYLGFICQLCTLSMFLLDLCQDGIKCSMGPGAKAAILSSISWIILSIEMKTNSPLTKNLNWNGVVVLEKEPPYITQMKKAWLWITGNGDAPSLSRTARKRQKERIRMNAMPSPRYRAPEAI